MKIIVVGGGKVGRTLVEQLIAEGHDIAVIDSKSRVITNVTDNFDVLGVQGNGASYIQQDAGIEEVDLMIMGETRMKSTFCAAWWPKRPAAAIPSPASAIPSTTRKWDLSRRSWACP